MGAALRGIGLFKPGMIVQTATIIINIVLAPIFIFGWGTASRVRRGRRGDRHVHRDRSSASCGFSPTSDRHDFLHFVPALMKPRLALWGDMLKIGLPAGAEFGLMAVYLGLVYWVTPPFGAAAQAGFGIGLRIVQSAFLPVVALGFSVAPVAGQNFGARRARSRTPDVQDRRRPGGRDDGGDHRAVPDRTRRVDSDLLDGSRGDRGWRRLSADRVAGTSSPRGSSSSSSSMFQALGNTLPPLLASLVRLVLIAIPMIVMSRWEGFSLRWIWYLSVLSVLVHMLLNLYLLRREFRRRLRFDSVLAPEPIAAPAS